MESKSEMKIIGLTGGVGAGKSTVLEYLEQHFSACVIQADQVGHLVMEPGGVCYEPVTELFGKKIIKKDKTIDRRMVSDIVFSNEEMRRKLNGVVHPAVKQQILKRIREERSKGCRLLVVEAALLLEDHYEAFCHKVWYVHTDREIRITRLMESRGYSRRKAEEIMSRQASEEFFFAHADYVVENSGQREETCRQIEEGIRRL